MAWRSLPPHPHFSQSLLGDAGSNPGLRRSPREGNGNHSNILAWETPWTEEPGWATVRGVTKSWTRRLNNNRTMGEHHEESVLWVFTLSGPHRGRHWGSGWSWAQVSVWDSHLREAVMGRPRFPSQVCVRGQDTERRPAEAWCPHCLSLCRSLCL